MSKETFVFTFLSPRIEEINRASNCFPAPSVLVGQAGDANAYGRGSVVVPRGGTPCP